LGIAWRLQVSSDVRSLRRPAITIHDLPSVPLCSGKSGQLRVQRCGTATIVSVSGELDLGSAPELNRAVADIINNADESVVLDLTKVEFLDSAAIHAVLRIARHARAKEVRLVILPAAPGVHAPFVLAGIEGELPFIAGGAR
jgi:anti-anti-sigma factor